jgi:hypothetical protein
LVEEEISEARPSQQKVHLDVKRWKVLRGGIGTHLRPHPATLVGVEAGSAEELLSF